MSFLRSQLLVSIVAAMSLGACRASDAPAENRAVGPPAADELNLAEELPLPQPALDRASFLKAVAAAASAQVAGTEDRAAQQLDGRRFAIRLRFGCEGPATVNGTAALRWTQNEGKASVEISAKPDLSLADKSLDDISDQTIEAVEGFWIPRPWQLNDSCPAAAPDGSEAALPAPQLVGIAQYFTAQDSRVGRRSGRPYLATKKIQSPDDLPKSGLILLLEGRFEAWPGGEVIRCTGSGRNRQPTCIASAHLDRAAFLRPEDDSVIAEWRE